MATNPHGRTPIDRVAIVTGGSHGVGCEVARKLAGRDYAVVIHYARNQVAAETAVEEALAANGTALAVRADVADELDVERLFGETTEAFGGVDVVVHADGQIMNLEPVVDYDLDMFDALLRTNVRGMFVVNQLASRLLRPGGAIVSLSCASVGSASPSYAYAACMGAVEVLTPVLARELRGRDVTVNAVAAVIGHPDSMAGIANVVAFLVSTEGHSVNGQVIRAEGGFV